MRTETYTLTKDFYEYNELSVDAKENAKRWLLDGRLPEWYSEDVECWLSELFPNSKLDIQYSLGYCQGDGANVYGSLNMNDAIDYIKESLTDKEEKFLRWAAKTWWHDIELPENRRYCYSIKDQVYVYSSIFYDLQDDGYKNIKGDVLEKFEELLQNKLSALDGVIEKSGYEYFYEIDDVTAADECECNGYEFDEDGNIA